MTAVAYVHPDLEPVSILRGLDPAAVQAAHPGKYLVYLIHLDRPLVIGKLVIRHYVGFVFPGNLARRMITHRTSPKGSRTLIRARRAGITWHLARVWEGDWTRERQIKKQGGASRFCPSCGVVTPAERQRYRGARGRYATTGRKTA